MAQSPVTAHRGVSEIQARWCGPLGLAPDNPADPGGQWHGPCPRCAKPKKLSVRPGDIRPVIWRSHCPDHPDEAVYAALKYLVPTAPPPGKPKAADPAAGELAALKAAAITVASNKNLTPTAKNLALLEVLGFGADEALDHLGIADTGNRTRTRKALRRGLAGYPRSPARTLSPARTVKMTAPGPSRPPGGCQNDSPLQLTEQRLTCGNTGLTDCATLVLVPEGNGHHTDTDTALDLVTSLLGAEVISTEPRSSPLPVSGTVDAWQLADEGPCHRCGTRTCVYGPNGNPMCADCRAVGLVSTTGR